jgi:hypothetical protein
MFNKINRYVVLEAVGTRRLVPSIRKEVDPEFPDLYLQKDLEKDVEMLGYYGRGIEHLRTIQKESYDIFHEFVGNASQAIYDKYFADAHVNDPETGVEYINAIYSKVRTMDEVIAELFRRELKLLTEQ